MAKSNRQVYKIPQPRMPKNLVEAPSKPVVPAGPERNRLCFAVFWTCLITGIVLDTILVCCLSHNAVLAYSEHPINWVAAVFNTIFTVLALMVVRAIAWGSLVLGATVASRTQSYTAQATFCHWARKLYWMFPDRSVWATQTLLQKMIEKEQYQEAVTLGSAEYEIMAKRNPKDQSLANLASTVAYGYLLQNEQHRAIEWSEKSVKSYELLLESIAKSGGIKKYAGQQVMETIQIQYAQALVGLATSYFEVQNRLKAKEAFKNALQQARNAPDSAEKRNLIKSCEENLKRLKHF